jgi:hypothetical protein
MSDRPPDTLASQRLPWCDGFLPSRRTATVTHMAGA